MRNAALALVLVALAPAAPLHTVQAQTSTPNQAGVAFGHLHYHVRDLEANKRFWTALGAKASKLNDIEVMKFPGFFVLFNQGESKGGSEGSIIDHIGFRVPNAKQLRDKMQAAGFQVKASEGAGGGSIYTPEGERLELFQGVTENVRFIADDGRKDPEAERNNRELTVPFALHHIHFNVPESEVPKIKAWYVRVFGAIPGKRFHYAAADVPGVNLNFLGVPEALAPTKGRVLDHIGFEIKNLKAFCKKLESQGIKIYSPYKVGPSGLGSAHLTDPWGTDIELTEGLSKL